MTSRRQTFVALSLVLAPLAGCAGRPSSSSAPPQWHAERVALIGADSGAYAFSSIRSVLLSSRGALYVVDDHERTVTVFDSLGSVPRVIGRTGAGPGEYRDPYSLAWLGDTLAILDPRNARIELLDRSGRWAGSWPVQPNSGWQLIRLYRTGAHEFWRYGSGVRDGKVQSWFLRNAGDHPGDTLVFVHPSPAPPALGITCRSAGAIKDFSAPFAPTLLDIPAPDGLRAVATTDAYRIVFLGPQGDTLRTIAHQEPAAAISDSEWAAGLAEWSEFRHQNPGAKCDRERFERPAAKPPLLWLFYDDQGVLWVEVRTSTGSRYDRYDPTGAPLPSVTGLPPTGGIDPSVAGDRIAIVLGGEESFPRVGIYRIVATPATR
jgi:hypothetical protein